MNALLRLAIASTVVAALFGCTPLAAQSSEPPTPEELAALERVRPAIEAIWADTRTPAKPGEEPNPRYFFDITDALIGLGRDATPFLIAELDLEDAQTFNFAAYALGRVGGPGAEEALRKATRRADDRGGRFGQACKRLAVYGLALLGVPDVVDLAQEGEPVAGTINIPDLYLMPQLALMLAPASVPLLSKQLETYRGDPATATKLEWALSGLGHAGDPSVVPAILPLLSSDSVRVRAFAVDAIGRLGDGAVCEKLVPLLASSNIRERQRVALALARVRPEPCVGALIARLQTETDIEVRAQLYRAVALVQGEAALEVLRPFTDPDTPYEPTTLVDAIDRIGSRKGLNLLRAVLKLKNQNGVQRALEALASIGGEGAIDTLLAMTGDVRPMVRLLACRSLTEIGVKRAGPRVATNLLGIVSEPVGNLSQRAPILEYAESLVTLRYTEPIPELAAAVEKQSDPLIVGYLKSCITRLKLLAEIGDDDTKWTAKLTVPDEAVRRLAADRLAELGSPAAVASLDVRLADPALGPSERTGIWQSIGQARTERAASLVERHLADPAYDGFLLRDARYAAAWAARRIGGDRMHRALRDSAIRREGRDFATLTYWAVADPAGSREAIKSLRARRLRFPEPRVGREDDQLDDILRELAQGRAPRRFDVPPVKLMTIWK